MELKGKKAIVVGAGKSGVGAARFLARAGAHVVLNDVAPIAGAEALPGEGIRPIGGGHPADLFGDRELIVMSPGVPDGVAPLKGIIADALARGAEVMGELELGARFTRIPIVAVTGTNGKSTTTTLIGEILKCAGMKVFTGGNLGTPLTEFLLKGETADWLVLEVSSFQLERIEAFRPRVSVLLNVTDDHLDRYASFDDYAAAKGRIFMNQSDGDFALVNGEDETVMALARKIGATAVPFTRKGASPGGIGIEKGGVVSAVPGAEGRLGADCLARMGLHNAENLMAAFGAARLCGASQSAAETAVMNFRGLPHRMEFVGEAAGIRFVDDSKATNVGAVVRSLESLTAKAVLIAGGVDKGGSYEPLLRLLREKVRALVLIGEAAPKIASAAGNACPVLFADHMDGAVEQAWRAAEEGDVVLLAPACSSFDMFKNYAHRGDVFQAASRRVMTEGVGPGKEAAHGR